MTLSDDARREAAAYLGASKEMQQAFAAKLTPEQKQILARNLKLYTEELHARRQAQARRQQQGFKNISPPVSQPPKQETSQYCENCGVEIMPDSDYCSRCGTGVNYTFLEVSQPQKKLRVSQRQGNSRVSQPQKKSRKRLIALVAVLVVVVLVGGIALLAYSAGNTDYSSHYNSIWEQNVIEKPFYKTTSENGNVMYVGLVRNSNASSIVAGGNTITFELVSSQSDAAAIYQNTVTTAANNGYNSTPVSNGQYARITPIQAWQGTSGIKFESCAYYQDPNVGNAWVVETQYA